MTWVSVSDDFTDHPKFRHLDDDATALWIRALAFANRHLTDGVVPAVMLRDLSRSKSPEKVAAKLCAASGITGKPLWSKVEDGYQIHDFHDYQPSARAVRSRREDTSAKRAESGRKGAESRWHNGGERVANESQTDSQRMANGRQTDSQRMASDSPSPSPLPNPDRSPPLGAPRAPTHTREGDGDPEPEPSPPDDAEAGEPVADAVAPLALTSPGVSLPEKSPRDRRKPQRPCPDDFRPSESNWDYAAERGLSRADVDRAIPRFVNWHQARDNRFADWPKAFRNWLENTRPGEGEPTGPRPLPGVSTLQQPSQCWEAGPEYTG